MFSHQYFHFNFQVLSRVIFVENENRKYSFVDLIRTPKMRQLALLTGTMWCVSFLIWKMSATVLQLKADVLLSQLHMPKTLAQ